MNNETSPLSISRLDDFLKARKSFASSIVDRSVLKEIHQQYKLRSPRSELYVLYDSVIFFVLVIDDKPFTDHQSEGIIFHIISSTEQSHLLSSHQQHTFDAYCRQIVSFFLYTCFYIKKSHHAYLIFPASFPSFGDVLERNHFQKEATLINRFRLSEQVSDGILMSISEEQFSRQSTGYIFFSDHGLVVRSTDFAIFEIAATERNTCIPKSIKPHGKLFYALEAYPLLIRTLTRLEDYLCGRETRFDVPMEYFHATPFQKRVWQSCMNVAYGQTASYEEIAISLGSTSSPACNDSNGRDFSRAVGLALSKNPLMIMIPCHRIIGKDGKLRGFAGGIDLKDFLLTSELFQFSNEGGSLYESIKPF